MTKKILLLLLVWSFANKAMTQTDKNESTLKAVFIYNFTKYIEWDNIGNEFIIGVIGSSPVSESLTEIVKTNRIRNKRITLKYFSRPEDISYCHVLFIPKNLPFPLSSILDKIPRGVLTVSEEEGYGNQGTVFNFVIINDKLKFEA